MSHAHLAVDGVSHSYADRRVLTGITFTASSGDRIGLVGENGTGKSTLLRILAGELVADVGSVAAPGSVALLEQQLPYSDDAPVGRVLDDAEREPLRVLGEIERIGDLMARDPGDPELSDAYAASLEAAERNEAWAAEAKRGEVITGLGLGGIAENRPIGELSGGQRLRLSLAAVLLRAPHTLLLDEPSNHLDDDAAAYLEGVLIGWRGIVIVASHDRALLDAVTTRILDLDALPVPAQLLADFAESDGNDSGTTPPSMPVTDDTGAGFGVRLWGVGYSEARAARKAEVSRWRARYEAESDEREALIHEIDVGSREVNRKNESKSEAKITRKFYADKDARVTARRARNARVRLETLDRERMRRPPEPLRFAGFNSGDPEVSEARRDDAAALALSAHRVAVAGRLREVSFEVPVGGRLLLAGPNGSGKSTLLAVLAGEAAPDTGSVERAARIGYLPQEVVFEDPMITAAQAYRDAVGFERAEESPLTATGLLAVRDTERPVGSLSVGQQRRVALAALVADPPTILLLDEPTNHLSLTLVEELEEALRSFEGAIVIATHDRWLRSRWDSEILRLPYR